MSKEYVLRNTGAQLSVTFYQGESVADPGTVTVTITRADGTAVATAAATSGTGAAARTYTLAPQTNLNDLTAVWSGTVDGVAASLTTHTEVVGGYLFTLAQARAFDAGAMSNTTTYPAQDIYDARERITDDLENLTGVSWVPRFHRVALDGDGTDTLILPNKNIIQVQSVTIDGTALTAPELADIEPYDDGSITRVELGTFAKGKKNVVVEYDHGFETLKNGADRTALLWLRYTLVRSNIPKTAIQEINSLGTFRMSVPDAKREHPTGIPEVDSWLFANDHRTPGVA